MKKYLAILNGMLTPWHVADALIDMVAANSSFLDIVFMKYSFETAEYHYPFPNDLSLTLPQINRTRDDSENNDLLDTNIHLIKSRFEEAKINFKLSGDTGLTLGDIIKYSAFNDVLFADANESLGNYHIADLLADAHAPIYLISKDAVKAENVIFTYNGTFSSMYAIKMFAFIFPELKSQPTTLVYVSSEKSDRIPQENNLHSWLSIHYPDIQTKVLFGNIEEALVDYTNSLPQSLTIMGSFGRSAMSRFFHKSLAQRLIEDGKSSLFIAHE